MWFSKTDRTGSRWLLVFDNVDNPDVLLDVLPATTIGSIIITSRDSAVGFNIGAEPIEVLPFGDDVATSALLSLVNRTSASGEERDFAMKVVKELGGLPLAINQISGFIVQQRLTFKDFLPLYERNASKIDGRKLLGSNYDHTLSTVWELALNQLSGVSATLQKLLAFFDPDEVFESLLMEGARDAQSPNLQFLKDDME